MTTYVIIGYDSQNVDISYENLDILGINKIYLLGNDEVEETEIFKSITDKNILSFYEEMDFENKEDLVIFIDCRGKSKTYFDIMYSLNTARFDNRSYYTLLPQYNKKININLKEFPFKENYNPWKGSVLPSYISESEKEAILEMFYQSVLMIKSFLKFEFHLMKFTGIPEGWMLNTSTPILQHIINYYGLKPNAKDIPPCLELLHNTQYRQIITKTLIHICSNFLINNKIVNYLPEEKTTDFWFKLQTWNTIEF